MVVEGQGAARRGEYVILFIVGGPPTKRWAGHLL